MFKRVVFGSLLLAVAVPVLAKNVYDPGQKGPLAVGYTSLMLIDPSRDGDGSLYPHRPIPVCLWYPADKETLSPLAPEATYVLDPLYSDLQLDDVTNADGSGLPVTNRLGSSEFEKYGIDHAYQEPRVSMNRPFPLMIFSPGFGASCWQHASFGARLASHGFVVAIPYHLGDASWWWEQYDGVALASYNRPRDVSFVLTDLLSRNGTPGNLLFGAITPDQVAAGGWSLGGYASMVLAGGDDSVCDTLWDYDPFPPPAVSCGPSFPDSRFKAIVPLDGSGWILHFNELARITVPALGMGEEWSFLANLVAGGGLPPGFEAWQARQHAAYQGHPAYRVDVANANHAAFSDLCENIPMFGDIGLWDSDTVALFFDYYCAGLTPTAQVHTMVGRYAIAFLKTNVVGEAGYQNFLTPGWALTKEQYAEFFVTEKRDPNSIDEDWPDDFIYFMHQPGSAQARGNNQAEGKKNPTATMGIPRIPAKR